MGIEKIVVILLVVICVVTVGLYVNNTIGFNQTLSLLDNISATKGTGAIGPAYAGIPTGGMVCKCECKGSDGTPLYLFNGNGVYSSIYGVPTSDEEKCKSYNGGACAGYAYPPNNGGLVPPEPFPRPGTLQNCQLYAR